MQIIDKKIFRAHPLTKAASQYLFNELYKHVQTTILLAYFTAIALMLFELERPNLIALWLIPMCILQALRYVIATPSLKLCRLFLTVDYLGVMWWVAYLFIFGLQTTSTFEFTFRIMLVYIVITFYLNVMRYHLPTLIINSSIICFGILIYLFMFTQLSADFKNAMGLLVGFGLFSLLIFGRMSNILAIENYDLIKQNNQLIHKMDTMLTEDELTKQYNRRYFNTELSKHLMLFDTNNQPVFCLATIDIDLFKHVNDSYGHDVGDEVLIQLSEFIRNQIRNTDIFARYGGEEFMILFPHSTLPTALKVLDKVRINCEKNTFQVQELQLKLTISIGVTEVVKSDHQSAIIKRADTALYGAKQNGRNCIGVKESETDVVTG